MDKPVMPLVGNKPATLPQSRFSKANILVVDDSQFNLKLISSQLAGSGYTSVVTAVDGVDGLQKSYKQMPDLILLDIMMPNLDGFGFCEQIRSDPSAPYMPIIVQTALDDRETKLRALKCGADDFLNKPLDLEEVALRVHVHLERYFILQDLENMRMYLRMELDQAQNTIKQLEENAGSGHKLLDKHYEVLGAMAAIPSKH